MGCYREVRREVEMGDTMEREKDGIGKEWIGMEERRTPGLT